MTTQTYGYHDKKDALQKRLNRVEGQIRGIGRMVQGDTYCIDIITQISAAQAALDKVALELLREHAASCLQGKQSDSQRKADELVSVIARMI